MAKSLDANQAGYLAALNESDPEAKNWTASWALMGGAKRHGADAIATGSLEGAFAVCKELSKRKLVDKQEGRASKMENGYSINDAGKEALKAHQAAQEG